MRIEFALAKQRLMKLASSNELYQKYLLNLPFVRGSIKSNEVLIYGESQVSISEEKNWKAMERTSLSYARYPTWRVEPRKIADIATVAFTDKAIYLLSLEKSYVYPYSKIVNIDFVEQGWNEKAYFEVKTTSPHPHKFAMWATDGKSKEKSRNIVLFLACLCGWQAH